MDVIILSFWLLIGLESTQSSTTATKMWVDIRRLPRLKCCGNNWAAYSIIRRSYQQATSVNPVNQHPKRARKAFQCTYNRAISHKDPLLWMIEVQQLSSDNFPSFYGFTELVSGGGSSLIGSLSTYL